MGETLIIRNFGPIKDMSFEFKKINILIGDQGTGKSIVAKVLIAIKNSIFREIFDLPKIDDIDKETQKFFEHLNLVGVKNFVTKETLIIYDYPDYHLEFKEGKVKIDLNVKISLSESIFFNFNYIPAERNMISVLADSLYALLEVQAELPKLFLRFGNKFQSARKRKDVFDYRNILGVSFLHKNGKDYIILPNGLEINFSDASSGIQGSVVLLTVFDDVMAEVYSTGSRSEFNLLAKNLKLLVIEEPELNCFPATQNKLLEYIIKNNKLPTRDTILLDNETDNPDVDVVDNYENYIFKNELVLTTHSPYILTSLNNMMYAYSVGQKDPSEANDIIDKQYWVNPKDVSSYRLLANGTCENIIDEEEDLIKAEKIDEVSGFLNEQFDALLNIELVKK